MRIQHNIAAMNSYRNYTANASALSKNLEKLSSGYRINRAGDDAAGLAISEKMRAQIAGLDQAQANVKDGISLVKTAEGALQEVQDMMNRMVTLATQSANGTYQDEVDRENLQDEVEALKSEINRIADSSNFNGQKLLNGDLSGGTAENAVVKFSKASQTLTTATKHKNTVTFTVPTNKAAGDKVSYEVTYKDANNNTQTTTVNFNITSATSMTAEDGTTYTISGTPAPTDFSAAVVAQLNKAGLGSTFTMNGTAAATTFEAINAGADKGSIVGVTMTNNGTKTILTNAQTTQGKGAFNTIAMAANTVPYTGATGTKAEDYIMTVNGHKFAFATAGNTGAFDDDVHVVVASATPNAAEAKTMVETINRVVGSNVASVNGNTATSIDFVADADAKSGGLTLQIGDTAEDYNQLTVSIDDMHTKALGIADIDIGNIKGAQDAIQTIKDAINKVSSTRGGLGAIQNRLEHTQNNLSVMAENIQDAESTIRDTDIADEMTAYTKNNILLQSAQAMLAQANQMPQGVLQLLQ